LVEIRELKSEDLEKVSRLSRLVLLDTWKKYARDYYPKKAVEFDVNAHNSDFYSRILKDPNVYCFIAEEEEEIVGVAIFRIFGKSGLANLVWIAVHPSFQRRGIGRKLLMKIIEQCESRKCHKIFLHTMPVLIPAINLYLKMGFKPEALLRKHWWGVDFIIMSKWLNNA